jgi:hypothetical protein
MKKLPLRDPEGAAKRASIAQRRVGEGARCACGETRPLALIRGSNPMICAQCQRQKKGHSVMDDHHPFAVSNDPKTTVPIPVNDHRADLNEKQYDWPQRTRDNPDGSPLLAAAGTVRGFVDTIVYLIEKGLLWVAELLEKLDEWATTKLGQKYWVGSPWEALAPKPGPARA